MQFALGFRKIEDDLQNSIVIFRMSNDVANEIFEVAYTVCPRPRRR